MQDAWGELGIGKMVATLDVLDHATRYKAVHPVASYAADVVTTKLREFMGKQKVHVGKWPAAGEAAGACRKPAAEEARERAAP